MTANPEPIRPSTAWEWVRRAQEVVWLLLVFVVPLAFLSSSNILSSPVIVFVEIPKVAILSTLALLMGTLWLAKFLLAGHGSPVMDRGAARGWVNIRRWFRLMLPPGPAGWVRLAAAFYFGSVVLSTLF